MCMSKGIKALCLCCLMIITVLTCSCNKKPNDDGVSDLGVDIVSETERSEITKMTKATSDTESITASSTTVTEFESSISTLSEETTTTTETSESVIESSIDESKGTTIVSSDNEVETTSISKNTTIKVTAAETTTVSDIQLPFLDVTAGTTTIPITEDIEEDDTSILRDLKYTLNVTKNEGKSYWYNQLTETESEAYKKLLGAVLKYEPSVDFDTSLTTTEYNRVFALLYGQNPELFWMSGKTTLSKDGKTATLFYLYDKKTAEGMQATLDKRVEELLNMMSTSMTDLEKVLLCHNYIVKYNSYSKETAYSSNVYGCLIDGKSQCAGYAKGFQYLCDQLAIPCIYVNGISAITGNTHAWNQVKLNGEWYNVDCMWDDPEMSPEDKKNVSYRYMGVPSRAILGITHLNANMSNTDSSFEYFKLPECTAYSENADIRHGVYATTYEEIYEKLKQGCFKAVEEGRYCAHVKVESYDVYVKALEKLFAEKEVYNIRKEINAVYGKDFIKGFSAAPENTLNYIEVTLKYGEGNAPA